jgi:hypothetical protein
VDDGYFAGENHIVTVAVMPISCSYSVSGASLGKHGAIGLELGYEINAEIHNFLYRDDPELRQKAYNQVQDIVANPNDVVRFAFHGTENGLGIINRDGGGTNENVKDTIGDPFSYLIVTTSDLLHSMRRIAALKRQKGFSVSIVTIEDAVSSQYAQPGDVYIYGGDPYIDYSDDAGKLRQFVKHCFYHKGTDYLLLAGSDVPKRGSSDLYYSDLDCSWIAGNYYLPELKTGRLFGDKPSLFDNYTNKLFRYELNPGNGDYSYLQRGLCSEDSIYNYGYGTAFSGILSNTTEVFERPNLNPTGCDFIDSISINHYGYWGSCNYGTPSYIQVSSESEGGDNHYIWAIDSIKVSPNGIVDTENGNGLNNMLNKEYPMLFFSLSGRSIPYYPDSSYGNMNFGQSFTMGKDYGGPVYVGLSNNSETLERLFFASMFSGYLHSGNYLVSEALNKVREHYNANIDLDCLSLYFNYLGDPAVFMWLDIPQEYSGLTVSRSNHSITVSGLPVGAIVSYCSNDGSVGQATSTTSVLTLNPVSPNSTIMVSKHGFIPYIAPLLLQNIDLSKSQYVIASDVMAGKSVDSNRTQGDVTVKSGAEYEIEAKGNVKLSSGFKVEKGARFSVLRPSF